VTDDKVGDERRPDGPPAASAGRLSQRSQWVLVALLTGCVLGFPIAILLWPPTVLSYRDAFLGLAMIPGILLAVTALWLAFGGR
jgi:hypothetical protein